MSVPWTCLPHLLAADAGRGAPSVLARAHSHTYALTHALKHMHSPLPPLMTISLLLPFSSSCSHLLRSPSCAPRWIVHRRWTCAAVTLSPDSHQSASSGARMMTSTSRCAQPRLRYAGLHEAVLSMMAPSVQAGCRQGTVLCCNCLLAESHPWGVAN